MAKIIWQLTATGPRKRVIAAHDHMKPRPLTRPQQIKAMSDHARRRFALDAFLFRNHFMLTDSEREALGRIQENVLIYVTTAMLSTKQEGRAPDGQRRWMVLPHPHEVAPCCAKVPALISYRSPINQMWREHCRSAAHVAALASIPVNDLRRIVKAWRKLHAAASVLAPLAS